MILTKDAVQKILLEIANGADIESATKIIWTEFDALQKNFDCTTTMLTTLGIDAETISAIDFLKSLPSLPMSYTDDETPFIKKLNDAVKILRNNPAVWFNLNDLPHEIWHDVTNFEEIYQISNYGRFKSFYDQEKILKARISRGGYPSINLYRNGIHKIRFIHVLVAQTFLLNPNLKPFVHHRNNDRKNACAWNLEWVTKSENVKYAFRAGAKKAPQGHENFNAKLTEEQVRWIRSVYKPRDKNFGCQALANQFSVSINTISNLIHIKSYTNVK